MPTPSWTRIVVALAAGAWFVTALLMDVPVDQEWLRPLGSATSAVVLLLLAFDRWLWRLFPTKVIGRPKLYGTWGATLEYDDTATGERVHKPCFIVIRQDYSRVRCVDLFTDISVSRSENAAILGEDGRRSLWFSYWSGAHALERDGNPPHRGAAQLTIATKPTVKLAGDYWTDRQTRGRIAADTRTRHCYDDYASAAENGPASGRLPSTRMS
jgi:SMODS-associating 2TM, beta-strand rich effector domain